MAQKNRDNQKRVKTKHSKNYLRLITIIVFIVLFCILFWFIIQYKTVEQRLAAIDAARIIPEAENAAILYNKETKRLLDEYYKEQTEKVELFNKSRTTKVTTK